jgi:hypothetical protein
MGDLVKGVDGPNGNVRGDWIRGSHELKMMGAHGENATMLVTNVDVVDMGIGCGP